MLGEHVSLLDLIGDEPRPLRVAMLAPPWITVPPPGYGGIESVVELLSEQLVVRGHDVTLFAAPGSSSPARVRPLLESAQPRSIGSALFESDHVASAFDAIDEAAAGGEPFDVIHDHSGFCALSMAARAAAPVVHTLHTALTTDIARFYERHAHKAQIVAISRSQAQSAPLAVRVAAVVPNPVVVDRWPFCADKDDYLLWVGRMDPVKGPHRAIEAAQIAGRRLVLAGPVQKGQETFFRTFVEPHVDGDRVRYFGPVAGRAKQQLFARAAALLMPIRWAEPFGMVMIEAHACGTPVISFREGAAREIVIDGLNGMLVADERDMAQATTRLASIDPRACRQSARRRYDAGIVARDYEAVYRRAIARGRPGGTQGAGPAASHRRTSEPRPRLGTAVRV
ncbi:MAG: glycosyltransferase family 4 protein [Thermoleophilia bacterium]